MPDGKIFARFHIQGDESIQSLIAKLKKNRRLLAAVLVLVVVFAILVVDIGILSFAAALNDSACRNAAEAGARGSDYTKATTLAHAALKTYWTDGYIVSKPAITFLDYQTFGGNPPPGERPFVQVQTEVIVKLPLRIPFFGLTVNDNHEMVFKQTYAYPIIKPKP